MKVIIGGCKQLIICDLDNGAKITDFWNSDKLGEKKNSRLFEDIDECKQTAEKLLLTSSGDGGVLILDKNTFKADFIAELKNAHSLELLPDGKVTAAASTGGDCLCLYEPKDAALLANPVQKIDFLHAHALRWDKKRSVLWAGGNNTIIAYSYDGESLKEKKRFDKVIAEIHDMSFLTEDSFIVTGDENVVIFDLNTGKVKEFEKLVLCRTVKSCSVNAEGFLLYTQALEECWWTDSFFVISPDGTKKMYKLPSGTEWYKARWY
ncbi:MAG: hypothetical protein A2252_10790 [Elusimicrobia bacterium RIFOXYA2_FULL_39_19]|nr:MAG: hypothetical protein A2252_10790 [Elusimicrobia bacterium RIFOXYA2_FULL_39_19]